MKEHFWDIKIADLLNNPGNTDKVNFKDKTLKTQEYKIKISGELFLQSLNHEEIRLEIKTNFTMKYICDLCLKEYSKIFEVCEKDIKFTNPSEIDLNTDEEEFEIDIKNQIINIKELLEILVKNQEPIIKDCGECKKKIKQEDGEILENNSGYTFDFSKLLKS